MVRKTGGNPIELWIEAEVRDLKTGKVLEKRKWKSRSWRCAMIIKIKAMLSYTNIDSPTITGELATIMREAGFYADASEGDDSYGIVVGIGTPGAYALGNKIPHGTGTGQLEYGAMNFGDLHDYAFDMWRNFVNVSGADITVSECGVYVKQGTYTFAIILDEISPPITVPDQASLRIVYTIKTV